MSPGYPFRTSGPAEMPGARSVHRLRWGGDGAVDCPPGRFPVRRFRRRDAVGPAGGDGQSLAERALRDPFAAGLVAATVLCTVFFSAHVVSTGAEVVVFWLVQ